MLDLELALNKLQSLDDRGVSSEVVDLPLDEFVLYLVCKSLEQQCSCDHKGFDFLIIDPLEEEPFDDVLFNVELNKSRLHANSKIKASCLRDGIKKREKLFTVGLDSFDTAESIIKWICWETSPESLSLLENRTAIKLNRSRRSEGNRRYNESLSNSDVELIMDNLREQNKSNNLDSGNFRWTAALNLFQHLLDEKDKGYPFNSDLDVFRKFKKAGYDSASDLINELTGAVNRRIRELTQVKSDLEGLKQIAISFDIKPGHN